MSTSISIQEISKSYELGVTHARSIRDLVNGTARRFVGSAPESTKQETFWALQDISFHVNEGEVVGIVGKNGAGKSTLLKILSQITKPTSGRAVLHGRVASLLEVGTGFHQELTGRENVFLNGTILGMTRKEVAERFDQIVEFSGVKRFIDTPVKRYSSGMTVRLGFAVAAHLSSEILIVDEVLAVGDIEFQKRCLSKMQDVASTGRTVLFVSHNLASVRNLTSRCVVLKNGRLVFDGETSEAISEYTRINRIEFDSTGDVQRHERAFKGLSQSVRFTKILMPENSRTLRPDEDIQFQVTLKAQENASRFLIGLTVFRDDDLPIGGTFSEEFSALEPGETVDYAFKIPNPPLAPGKYYCGISVVEAGTSDKHIFDSLTGVLPFEVTQAGFGHRHWSPGWGVIRLNPLVAARNKRSQGKVGVNR